MSNQVPECSAPQPRRVVLHNVHVSPRGFLSRASRSEPRAEHGFSGGVTSAVLQAGLVGGPARFRSTAAAEVKFLRRFKANQRTDCGV